MDITFYETYDVHQGKKKNSTKLQVTCSTAIKAVL